jgi:hypothetical protein
VPPAALGNRFQAEQAIVQEKKIAVSHLMGGAARTEQI